jgi:hypothetical protein
VQQYDALRVREIAVAQKKAEQRREALPKPTPPLPVSTDALAKTLASIGETHKKNSHQAAVQQLISRGSQLRSAYTKRPNTDAYTQQFQPMNVLATALAQSAPIPPYDVNLWLEGVARFIGENFAHQYSALQQTPLKKREPQEVVPAIDRNLAVLRLIEKELDG